MLDDHLRYVCPLAFSFCDQVRDCVAVVLRRHGKLDIQTFDEVRVSMSNNCLSLGIATDGIYCMTMARAEDKLKLVLPGR